eukprot:841967-Pelagomonas_calceolata.AAC.2
MLCAWCLLAAGWPPKCCVWHAPAALVLPPANTCWPWGAWLRTWRPPRYSVVADTVTLSRHCGRQQRGCRYGSPASACGCKRCGLGGGHGLGQCDELWVQTWPPRNTMVAGSMALGTLSADIVAWGSMVADMAASQTWPPYTVCCHQNALPQKSCSAAALLCVPWLRKLVLAKRALCSGGLQWRQHTKRPPAQWGRRSCGGSNVSCARAHSAGKGSCREAAVREV